MDVVIRVLAGGLIVSLFAVIGDLLKPKSFAGLFGAAPSVALATLTLAVFKDGKSYAAIEARSMIAGTIGFLVYVSVVGLFLARGKWPALPVTLASISLWFVAAFGVWFVVLR